MMFSYAFTTFGYPHSLLVARINKADVNKEIQGKKILEAFRITTNPKMQKKAPGQSASLGISQPRFTAEHSPTLRGCHPLKVLPRNGPKTCIQKRRFIHNVYDLRCTHPPGNLVGVCGCTSSLRHCVGTAKNFIRILMDIQQV